MMYSYYPETKLIPPKGSGIQVRGALPKPTNRLGVTCPLLREQSDFDVIPHQEWAAFIDIGANLTSQVWEIKNQGSIGSCAAESACGSLELIREQAGLPRISFNPYATYHFTSGGRDNGSTLADNLTRLRDHGAVRTELWPRSKGWRARPSDEALEDAKQYRIDEYYEIGSWDEFGTAMLRGWGVYFAIPGHAIYGGDVLNDLQARYANSWDYVWGEPSPFTPDISGGFGIVSRSSVQVNYGMYAVRTPYYTAA